MQYQITQQIYTFNLLAKQGKLINISFDWLSQNFTIKCSKKYFCVSMYVHSVMLHTVRKKSEHYISIWGLYFDSVVFYSTFLPC